MRAAKIEDFDLTTRRGRYEARNAGFDVPKQKPGPRPLDLETLIRKTDYCWEWMGTKDACGYGRVHTAEKESKAHREMYIRTHGPLADDVVIMHRCDNPGCVNPDHLIAGTHQLNQLDKVAKNRQARGESVGGARLTEGHVREIRRLYENARISQVELAARFSVSASTIHKIVSRKDWGHLA